MSADFDAAVVGGGETQALAGGGCTSAVCPTGSCPYQATRFGYAANGETVTFVMGEQWCAAPTETCGSDYSLLWAREFRYDSARARYMDAKLNTIDLSPATDGTVWTDYAGDSAYGDFTVSGSGKTQVRTDINAYQPGAWRKIGTVAEYLHGDVLGTLRRTTDASGAAGGSDTFTAFGERIAGSPDRHGFVGAYGYQSTLNAGLEAFPFQHLGHRYYDPSSGRFLQRDRIGIVGGPNVYAYADGTPTAVVDPDGNSSIEVAVATGALSAAEAAELLGTATAATAAAVAAKKAAEAAAKKAIDIAKQMARDRAAKQRERVLNKAKEALRRGGKFKDWFHKGDGASKIPRGSRKNPNLTDDEIYDAWKRWHDLSCPAGS